MESKSRQYLLFKKSFSILIFLIAFYGIPLFWKPSLLIHWQVIFLATFCVIIFSTQPRISFYESKQRKSTDKNTIWLIIAVSGIGQIMSLIEWAYFTKVKWLVAQFQFPLITMGDSNVVTYPVLSGLTAMLTKAGALMIAAGTFFRLYAIKVLGRHFTSTVQITDTHFLVSSGPYKYLRHPSYTGAYISMVGSALFLQSISGLLIFGIGMLFIYAIRIKAEEEALIKRFDGAYEQYCQHTSKMFPYIW